MMDNIVDLKKIKDDKRQQKELRKLDAQASYVIIEKCLKHLEMNKMTELDEIKSKMKQVLKKLVEIGKNG